MFVQVLILVEGGGGGWLSRSLRARSVVEGGGGGSASFKAQATGRYVDLHYGCYKFNIEQPD